jgi:hypothetical protein
LLQEGCPIKTVQVLQLTGLQGSERLQQQADAKAALLQLCKDFVATSAPTILVCQ